ncbi:MAG TPA: hypothetical protein VF753_07350 [Terriglobales bacterium]
MTSQFSRHRNLTASPRFRLSSIAGKLLSLFALTFAVTVCSLAQQSGDAPLPQAPQPQTTQEQPSQTAAVTAAFIGYATNRSMVFPDIATTAGPLSPKGKFRLFVNQSISPPYVFLAVVGSAINQARDIPKGYGQGWGAYGGRFGMSLARSSSASFFGTFLFASALHQDPRFFPESDPKFWGSVKYSGKRLFVTANDSQRDVFNSSGLFGPLAGEVLANVYLPPSEQTAAKTVTRWGTDIAWRFAGNMFRNYWPTLFRNMGLNRLKGFSEPDAPAPPPATDSTPHPPGKP